MTTEAITERQADESEAAYRTYEWMTAYIAEQIAAGIVSIPPEKIREHIWLRKKLKGSSGHVHEIDVSFEFDLCELSFLVLIECKCYSRSVSVEDVLAFSARIRDIGAHKGIMVTTRGFQKGAITVAASNGIALVRFDWAEFKVLRGFGRTLVAPKELKITAGGHFATYVSFADLLPILIDEQTAQKEASP